MAIGMTRAALVRRGVVGLGLAAGAGALALGACGVTGGESQGATKQPVKLVFEWPTYTQPKQEWAEWAMKTYSQKNPHVTIEPMWNTNPTEKLTTTIAGGQPPDLGWFGVGHWALQQAFAPVDPFLASRKIKNEDYLPKVVDAMKWRGKMLAFPMGINTSAMFVNKAHYQKAGLPLPTDEHTWDDLIVAGKRMVSMSGEGGVPIWGNNAPYYVNSWPPAFGGGWLDADGTKVLVNNPQTLKALSLLREMWDVHRVSPNPQGNKDIATSATAGFTTGRYGAFIAGTWGIDPARKESFD